MNKLLLDLNEQVTRTRASVPCDEIVNESVNDAALAAMSQELPQTLQAIRMGHFRCPCKTLTFGKTLTEEDLRIVKKAIEGSFLSNYGLTPEQRRFKMEKISPDTVEYKYGFMIGSK